MMDKKYLKDKKLLEAHKQFMKLCEWSYVPTNLEEDDDTNEDDAMSQDNGDMSMQPQQGDGNSDMNMGQSQDGNNMDMPQQDDMNMQPPQDGNNMDLPQQDDMSMQPPQGGENMDMPQQDEMPFGDNEPQEEDDVIDVDDITNAQEKMNTKVNHVGTELGHVDAKIEALLKSLDKMEQMIDNNNQEIANFKQEFEKRNPTQTEKLNLRSLDSYPFNVSPKDYWEKKGIDPNSNYSGYSDNDESTTSEYEITNNDVDNFNEREIEDSFAIEDELNQDIKKIFGL